MPNLMWFREHDLRCRDNSALYNASHLTQEGLIAIFFVTPAVWKKHHVSGCRIDFILRNLRLLSNQLSTLNIPLLILPATDYQEIPTLLLEIVTQYHINTLFFNNQYEINETRRDEAVQQLLSVHGINIRRYHDHVVMAPGEILTQANTFYTVFTPFKKAWIKRLQDIDHVSVLPLPKKQPKLSLHPSNVPQHIEGFTTTIDQQLWPAGEDHALDRLQQFISQRITDYQHDRDFPSISSTSSLSAYLTSGIISPRQCLQAALNVNDGKIDSGNNGVTTWISELIWREFYKHILFAFPRVSMHRAFQLATEKIPWQNNQAHFKAWQEGQTGIPIVDAAMRQLKQIGWMHNRLRMITAMFLSKNLLIDWRQGEQYFMEQLIDGDLSANNGGWQWSASTGTDAAPYFRIFNPISQSQRFDPDGIFIKKYCPELQHLSNKEIHDPSLLPPLLHQQLKYPKPIVDLKTTRDLAIKLFQQHRS